MSPFLFVHGRLHISQNAGPAPRPCARVAKLARRAYAFLRAGLSSSGLAMASFRSAVAAKLCLLNRRNIDQV
jgi:hypothetical protein